jgi:transposase InsO family protein
VNREFREHRVRVILLTDITFIKRCDGNFTYLLTIIDAYTHEALAYALSDSLEINFVLLTFQQLIEKHSDELTMPQESFFGHMKDEINISDRFTNEEICKVVEDWIDYYNNERVIKLNCHHQHFTSIQ